ncbi:hypothetical protein [Aurantiacibacter odishensis]|uniref:hypothetical protein n=1 Tax=Aurantiacibacter odishensis TaxID=1155476 RepID=UPI000E7346AC|nr:hypothetical protein [Aurantiacibacter odishensis]
MRLLSATFISVSALALATPAAARDEAFEVWLNPSIGTDLDGDTAIEIETAQRFRFASESRVDTDFFCGWLKQDVAHNVTLAGALEYRINDGGSKKVRTMQQLSTTYGILKTKSATPF